MPPALPLSGFFVVLMTHAITQSLQKTLKSPNEFISARVKSPNDSGKYDLRAEMKQQPGRVTGAKTDAQEMLDTLSALKACGITPLLALNITCIEGADELGVRKTA